MLKASRDQCWLRLRSLSRGVRPFLRRKASSLLRRRNFTWVSPCPPACLRQQTFLRGALTFCECGQAHAPRLRPLPCPHLLQHSPPRAACKYIEPLPHALPPDILRCASEDATTSADERLFPAWGVLNSSFTHNLRVFPRSNVFERG